MLDTCLEVAMSDNFNRTKSLNIFLVGYTSNNFQVAIIFSSPRLPHQFLGWKKKFSLKITITRKKKMG
jgi:hypothetical protein